MIASANTATRSKSNCDSSVVALGRIDKRLARYENANPREITYRLAELDLELDTERALELIFGSVSLTGMAMGMISSRKWYLLPALAGCFMVQHVMAGWCPPLPILRRLGFRKPAEINRERMALKAIRGDFAQLGVVATDGTARASLLSAIEE
jgi:hypothetical protein